MKNEESTQQTPKPLSEAENFEEFKALASAQSVPPVQEPKKEEEPVSDPPAKPEGETVGETDTPPPQDKGKQHQRKRDAESTIAEKTRLIKEREEENARLKAELEDLRKKSAAAPQAPPPAPEPPKPAAADSKPATSEPMKRSEFRKQYAEQHPAATYDECDDAFDAYRDEFIRAQTARQRARDASTAAMKVAAEKHPDFDAVLAGEMDKQGNWKLTSGTTLPRPVVEFATSIPNGWEALYTLVSNAELLRQVSVMTLGQQMMEIGHLAKTYTPPSADPAPAQPVTPPEKTNVRPITRVPAPAKHVLGVGIMPDENEGKPDPQDPNYERWKQAEAKRVVKVRRA